MAEVRSFILGNDFLYNAANENIEQTESEQQSEQELTETIVERVKKRGRRNILHLESGESAEHRRNKKR